MSWMPPEDQLELESIRARESDLERRAAHYASTHPSEGLHPRSRLGRLLDRLRGAPRRDSGSPGAEHARPGE